MPLRAMLLGATAILACAGAANAKGWYASFEAGAVSVDDTDAEYALTTGFSYSPIGRFDTGWALVCAVGYSLQGWHIEGEAGWRSNDKDRFTAPGPSTGDLDELTVMFNMTYDIPLGVLTLSLGGGAGLDYAMLDIAGVDDGDLNFAYQGIVGLSYAVSQNTELTLGYRYLNALDPEFEDASSGTGINNKFDDFSKHAVTAGVRYTFAP